MEVKKALLVGGVAVGGFLLGRALLQPQAPKQSPPPPPDPGFDDADKFTLCGYQFSKASFWSRKTQNDEYYVPRIKAHINSYLEDSDYYAEILAQYLNHWTFKYGLPKDLTLAIAIYRTKGGYNLEDAQIRQAIAESKISCGVTSRAQFPYQQIQGILQPTATNPLGPWGVPASLWPESLSCVVDLLSQSPKDRLWDATMVFTVLWQRLIKSTGRLESFIDLGSDDREALCDVVDIARTFADLR